MIDPSLQRRRRSIVARLGRVNLALEQLAEYEAAEAMPPELRPQVPKPALGRRALSALRTRLLEELAAIDERWTLRE